MAGVFVDGVHGAPYIAAPWILWIYWDRRLQKQCLWFRMDSPKARLEMMHSVRVSEEKPSNTLKSLEDVEADRQIISDYGRFRCASMCFKWILWKETHGQRKSRNTVSIEELPQQADQMFREEREIIEALKASLCVCVRYEVSVWLYRLYMTCWPGELYYLYISRYNIV